MIDPIRLIVALCLAFFGVYAAGLALGMSAAPPINVMFFVLLLEAVLALVTAYGVGRRQSWAATAVLMLGIVEAVRWLYLGFVIGVVAYLYALFMAFVALVASLAIVAYLSGRWRVGIYADSPGPTHIRS